MDASHYGTNDDTDSPARTLGSAIRSARKSSNMTIAQLAEQIGRPREWLNRVELGYGDQGERRPISSADLNSLINILDKSFSTSPVELHKLRDAAELEFDSFNLQSQKNRRKVSGKLIRAEVIIGESQLYKAAANMVSEQYSDAVIRNTGIWGQAPNYLDHGQEWEQYRKTLGNFLRTNNQSVMKRIEFVDTKANFNLAKESDKWSVENRDLNKVHNIKVKFYAKNPLLFDVLIGQREAIIELPQRVNFPSMRVALLVRDKLFVEALRTWFDEVLWDSEIPNKNLNYADFNNSIDEIGKMYGF